MNLAEIFVILQNLPMIIGDVQQVAQLIAGLKAKGVDVDAQVAQANANLLVAMAQLRAS